MFTEDQNPAPETPAATPATEASAPVEVATQPAATEPTAVEQPVTTTTPPAEAPKPTNNIPSDEKMLAAIGYLPMLFIGSLIVKPKSTFCQMHAKQGVLLTGLSVFVMFVLLAIPAIGSLLFLALLAIIAIGAFQAYSGIEWKIPFLWDFASKIDVNQFFAITPAPSKPTAEPKAEETEADPIPEQPTPPATPES